jgi:hypothetical protein
MMAEHRAGRVTGNRRSILTHMMDAQAAGEGWGEGWVGQPQRGKTVHAKPDRAPLVGLHA